MTLQDHARRLSFEFDTMIEDRATELVIDGKSPKDMRLKIYPDRTELWCCDKFDSSYSVKSEGMTISVTAYRPRLHDY